MKRAILLAAVACVAVFALPAMASAATWHLDKTDTFAGTGGTGTLKGSVTVTCTSTTITGAYTSTTGGTAEFTFHHCTGPFGISCTTPEQPLRTITTTELEFHNVVLGGKPGILLTPNKKTGVFAHFECLGTKVTVHGNGILGTTNQECGGKSAEAFIDFNVTAEGKQEHTLYTGTTYGLTSTSNEGSSVASTEDASGTIKFAGGERTVTCT